MMYLYTSSKVKKTNAYTPYTKQIDVYGLKILGLGRIGGQPEVQDDFLKKTAQTYKLLLNPDAPGINSKDQQKALKGLYSSNVIQRVGVKAYDAYSPGLEDKNYKGWDRVNDSTNSTDFIWHLRSDDGTYSPSGNAQLTETVEHALHTLTQFALPAAFPEKLNIFSTNGRETGIQGDLYQALQEAIDNNVYDISDYSGTNDGSEDYAQLLLREYLYCLIYAEWGFTPRYTEDKSLAPEWSDNHLTAEAISRDNPTGHRLFEQQISKVISKPSSTALERIFQDGDIGIAGYEPSSGVQDPGESSSNNASDLLTDIHSGQRRQKLKSGSTGTTFIFDYEEPLIKKNADLIIGFDRDKGDQIVLDADIYSALPSPKAVRFERASSRKALKQLAQNDIDLIYFEDKGQLYLNANGSDLGFGDKQDGGLLAVLKGGPSLTLGEIDILS